MEAVGESAVWQAAAEPAALVIPEETTAPRSPEI
jgi:hypothetical protein